MINLNETAEERIIRVFISSTFVDFQPERELLIKKVFPNIKKLCYEHDVDFLEIDLRWGVTEEQVQTGAVIDVCLSAIERCHPYFIGLLGGRYGWVPSEEDIIKYKWIENKYPVLKGVFNQHPSITDIEIQYGVLKREKNKLVTYFYFRNDEQTPTEFREVVDSIEYIKLQKLKEKIKGSKYPLFEYSLLDDLAKKVESDLSDFIRTKFPVETFNKLQKIRQEHATYARSRLKVYIEDKNLYNIIDEQIIHSIPIVISGEQGTGKTALIANWIAHYQKLHPDIFILYHFVGGASTSTNIFSVILRICEELKDHFNFADEIPANNQQILAQFSHWLFRPDINQKWVLVIDALNQLESDGNAFELNWLPNDLPENMSLILSTTPGTILNICKRKGYDTHILKNPTQIQKIEIIDKYLKSYEKSLSIDPKNFIAQNTLTDNVLILRTLLDELRIYGYYELLNKQIDYYLQADSPISFFQKILKRFEKDYETASENFVQNTLIYLCLSNYGLSEQELLELTNVPILKWIPFFEALRNHLVNRSGLLNFSHDYLRQAIQERYLTNEKEIQTAQNRLLRYFQDKESSKRTFSEIPFHLNILKKWDFLKDYLTDCSVINSLNMDEVQFDMINYWNSIADRYDIENEYEQSLWRYKSALNPRPDMTELFSNSFQLFEDQYIRYAIICVQVSKLLMSTSKYRLAIKLLEESCDIFMKYPVSSPEHYSLVFFARNMLINIYMKQKLHYRAEPLLIHTIHDLEEEYGKEDILVGVLTGTLGFLYVELKLFDKAENYLNRSLEIVKKSKGEISLEASTCFNNLAMLYNATSRYEKAESFLQKAIDLRMLFYGREHPETVTCVVNLAFFMLEHGKSDKAKELALEAIKSTKKMTGNNVANTARSYQILGICYLQDEDYFNAEIQLRNAYNINISLYGEINANTAECNQWLAICFIKQNKLVKAYHEYSKALDIFRTTLGYEHPTTIYAEDQVRELGKFL